MRLNELSAHEAAARIARGELSSEDLTRACLARIAEREPAIKAFAHVAVGEGYCGRARRRYGGAAQGRCRSGSCTACRLP